MKRFVSLFVALCLLTGLVPAALASSEEMILTATVQGRETIALKAPASGELAPFTVRAGDAAAAGTLLFEVEPVRVYADIEGTVAMVHAKAGDSADALASRYGALVQVDYADRYELHATTALGYKSAENRDLHVGTPVYLRSLNEEHFADGVITAVEGSSFTVQVIGGDLIYTHNIMIYRENDYNNKSLLGRASLSAVTPRGYTASGTVTEVAVKAGDAVQPGDYLFSYVPDQLEPERRGQKDATAVRTTESLIVTAVNVQPGASVQKGQTLLTAIRMGDYELIAQAEESEVHRLHPGDVFSVHFEESGAPSCEATVTAISPLGSSGSDVSTFEVRLAFTAPEGVWPGMHATLER